jgi:hypothetical protein
MPSKLRTPAFEPFPRHGDQKSKAVRTTINNNERCGTQQARTWLNQPELTALKSKTEIGEAAMTRFLNTRTIAPALAALAMFAATVPASAQGAFAKNNFDGQWSVLIVTQKGTCDRAYRYPVKIESGSVGYAGSASFNVSGKVQPTGAVTVTVSRGSQSATGTGRMSGTDGGGTWTAASGECSGTWTAERRAS